MPDFIKTGFGKRLLAMGIFLSAWAHLPLLGGDWSWTPIQLGVAPLNYLQFPPGRLDVYGIAVGGALAQERSAALSVALLNDADANYLVHSGLLCANDNNFAINVGGVAAGNNRYNCGVNIGGFTFNEVNCGVNVGGFVEIGRVNYGLNVFCFTEGLLLNCGLNLGLVPYCCLNKGLNVGVYNVVGVSGLFNWKFDNDTKESGGVQIGLLNVGSGFQLGLLNYNPCGPAKLLPLLNFYCQ